MTAGESAVIAADLLTDLQTSKNGLAHLVEVVIGNKDPDFQCVPELLHDGQRLVDFVRIRNIRRENGKYDGICW